MRILEEIYKRNSCGNPEKRKSNSEDFQKKRKFRANTRFEEKPRYQDLSRDRNNEVFDKHHPLHCYKCGASNHLRHQCPKLRNIWDLANINRIVEGYEEEEFLSPYKTIAEVNGHLMYLSRDTDACFDVICRKCYLTDV
ncbi:hypothetical protein NPIL_582321 [Nephila pilipes]|uniref:CCHC-type domain-containing protein n=1 Tax=Nephila pilipes TaxID=299642 RepID=A0A8X6N9C3_NEPPI|nr:hypothetical protein NPIL_582321 [Nephila pilipes]